MCGVAIPFITAARTTLYMAILLDSVPPDVKITCSVWHPNKSATYYLAYERAIFASIP